MTTQEANLTTASSRPNRQPQGKLILPTANRHTAALAGLIDSVLYKIGDFQDQLNLSSLTIGVASCHKRSGVSTVTHRLAMQAALNGEGRVLIVDANGVRPKQHELSAVAAGPGLVDHLANSIDLDICIQHSPIAQLDILPWGSTKFPGFTATPVELKEVFADLRNRYQFVFLDLPLMDEKNGSAALPFAIMSDGVVIVLDGASSRETPTKELVAFLEEHSIKVMGAIMNRYAPPLPRWLRRWF